MMPACHRQNVWHGAFGMAHGATFGMLKLSTHYPQADCIPPADNCTCSGCQEWWLRAQGRGRGQHSGGHELSKSCLHHVAHARTPSARVQQGSQNKLEAQEEAEMPSFHPSFLPGVPQYEAVCSSRRWRLREASSGRNRGRTAAL